MRQGKLKLIEGGLVGFWCPGCKEYHEVNVDSQSQPYWSFNGNYEKPTFSPSVMVRSGHFADGASGDCWCNFENRFTGKKTTFKCGICHSFITDGKIQYLSDCTHELAGKTIEMESVDNE